MNKMLFILFSTIVLIASSHTVDSSIGVKSIEFTEDNNIPYDAEVEWLQSTGKEYIDTGLVILNSDIVEGLIASAKTPPNNQKYIFGCREYAGTGYSYYGIAGIQGSYGTRMYMKGGAAPFTLGDMEENLLPFRLKPLDNYFNGKSSKFNNASRPSIELSCFLFAVNNKGQGSDFGNFDGVRIGEFTVERDGVILADFIAVRSKGEGCMYDKVSGKIFKNKGMGSFIIGPDL